MIDYIKNLIESHTKSSSKRAIAITTQLMLVMLHLIIGYVFVFKEGVTITDILILVGSDISFICTLLGIASYQSNTIKKKEIDSSIPNNKEIS